MGPTYDASAQTIGSRSKTNGKHRLDLANTTLDSPGAENRKLTFNIFSWVEGTWYMYGNRALLLRHPSLLLILHFHTLCKKREEEEEKIKCRIDSPLHENGRTSISHLFPTLQPSFDLFLRFHSLTLKKKEASESVE